MYYKIWIKLSNVICFESSICDFNTRCLNFCNKFNSFELIEISNKFSKNITILEFYENLAKILSDPNLNY